ncbi:uncharacterized protein C9orf85 homolog isoform X2 [Notamacropus eugenii]|uniref:uncharacterized protein C9orf85 homolog isoform X2 n=1 Tax=Notamacropus eugenii TaxID=9315 RepID=UPI003B680CFF
MQKRFLPGQPRSCRELRVSASQTQLLLAKSSGACFWGWGSPRSPRPPKPAAAEMSSQKGNVTRTRSQRHQNAFSFRNDKFDSSVRTKRINAKLHDGVCQHCKEVLEWRVKYSKYKPLSKPKKCVKCLQKTVKDSYHMICRPCACELEVCAKCGKKEEIVLPLQVQGSITVPPPGAF